jgi:hypothetical protein
MISRYRNAYFDKYTLMKPTVVVANARVFPYIQYVVGRTCCEWSVCCTSRRFVLRAGPGLNCVKICLVSSIVCVCSCVSVCDSDCEKDVGMNSCNFCLPRFQDMEEPCCSSRIEKGPVFYTAEHRVVAAACFDNRHRYAELASERIQILQKYLP